MPTLSLSTMTQKVALAQRYVALRAKHPHVSAKHIHGYLTNSDGETFGEYLCGVEFGHRFAICDSGYRDDGRCLCVYCGKDGDA